MAKVNLVLMRGLLGETYSRGMDVLGSKAAKLPNVDYVTVEDYGNWRSIRSRIQKWKDPTVLGGHSFGANAATIIAASMDAVKFPLLLTFDCSQHWSWYLFKSGPALIENNVKLAMNWYQTSGLIGRQKLISMGTATVSNIEVGGSSHVSIDDREDLHARALTEIGKL